MLTIRTLSFTAAGLLALGLSACATMSGDPLPTGDKETISYSVGPCFGFCPVYSVEVTSSGHLTYSGERHTAELGAKTRDAGGDAYNRVSRALAAYRPAAGTTVHTDCDQRVSDLQTYTITWTAPDGAKTTLIHDKGCRSPKNDVLNKVMEGLPTQLGIEAWTKQTTRPGVSRG
ncbi:DUF6438 domain-containing protein [Asticcacaulis sp. BYS171W]|uniref:DUF6438 domain-containing protein n=1 Tax=Asticcacaulis aquaticus TaxID=2984212 RepID=A0ABT5HVW5_9CAUL|nr:DUF6438 domain-containing protein [Asticcacaulis aquaticus]MDC7684198.1 DUF6438 domain-containing protein [Asticcacaulis aquaticus]